MAAAAAAAAGDSGGGGWGAFTPNISIGSSWTDNGFGGFGGSWSGDAALGGYGGGFGGVRDVGGGGGGGNWGAFTPNDDGFTNSEPLGGYAGTNPTYESITNLDPVTVTAKRPNTDTYKPVTVPYDPNVPWLDTVTVVEKYDWRSIEQPRDPDAKTLETITVKPPETNELTDRQWRDWWSDEQFKVFAPFTGGLASVYDGVKSWMRGDWWGVGLAIAAALPVGKFGGLGCHSFRAFKRAEGAAGPGMHWHHLVEQNPANLRNFGPYQIHNVDNLVRIDAATHAKLTGHYNSIDPVTGLKVRDMVSRLSFDEQYEYGLMKLREYGAIGP